MEKKGVSPVVGTILLIAITVALAAIVAMLVSGLGGRGAPPSAMLTVTAQRVDNTNYTLRISHEGGDDLLLKDLEVQWSNSDSTLGTTTYTTGTFTVGDNISISCTYAGNCTDKAITVYIIHTPSKQKLFSSSTVIVQT